MFCFPKEAWGKWGIIQTVTVSISCRPVCHVDGGFLERFNKNLRNDRLNLEIFHPKPMTRAIMDELWGKQ
jgi:hypothetical protein